MFCQFFLPLTLIGFSYLDYERLLVEETRVSFNLQSQQLNLIKILGKMVGYFACGRSLPSAVLVKAVESSDC